MEAKELMIENIEERSVQSSYDELGLESAIYIKGYRIGAEQQHGIDIDKACSFIRNHVVDFQNDATDSIDVDDLVETLRKEMI